MFLDGFHKFGRSSILSVFRAQYYLTYHPKSHLGIRALAQAEARGPLFDEHFIIFRRRKKLVEEMGVSKGGNSDIISKIAFEQHMKDAIKYDAMTGTAQIEFWHELQQVRTSF